MSLELTEDITQDDPILISGADPQGFVAMTWLLGGLAILIGGLRGIQRMDPPTAIILSGGVALLLSGIVVGVYLRFKRRYLKPTHDGFVYITAQSERTFLDEDVMCVSLLTQENYFFGNLRSLTTRFVMWVETSTIPDRIVCITRRGLAGVDPLQGFINRIVSGLYEAARTAHSQGERIEGDGWSIVGGQLLLKSDKKTTISDINELVAVEIVDKHINIWRQQQDLPIGRIPVVTANSQLLLLLLRDLIPRDKPLQEHELPDGSLGRIIFTRHGLDPVFTWMLWALVAMLGLVTTASITRAIMARRPGLRRRAIPWAISFGIMTTLASGLLRSQRQTYFRRHLYGVCLKGIFGERRLKFRDIANISYSAERQYSHGLYRGTAIILTFVSTPEMGLKKIRYATMVQNTDLELERLRDDISEVIAERMARYFDTHGDCPWTPFLRFTQESLEYRPLTLTGRKPAFKIPYSSIVNYSIEEGGFHLWVKDQKKSMVNEDVSQPNFFPGLIFLSQLIHRELLPAEVDSTELEG